MLTNDVVSFENPALNVYGKCASQNESPPKKADDKINVYENWKKQKPKLYIILRIQKLESKKCRPRGGSLSWDSSSTRN